MEGNKTTMEHIPNRPDTNFQKHYNDTTERSSLVLCMFYVLFRSGSQNFRKINKR